MEFECPFLSRTLKHELRTSRSQSSTSFEAALEGDITVFNFTVIVNMTVAIMFSFPFLLL